MKNILLSLTALAIIGFASCKKSDNTPSNSASAMFVNGCTGTTNVNATSGTTSVSGASNIAFMKSSGYQYVTAGTDSIAFVLTSLGTPLKTGIAALTANTHYSVFVGGLVTAPSFVVTTDDLSATTSGNAKVRFVNLSNDSLSETADVGSTAFATAIGSQSASSFSEVTAGSYTIKAGDPANISTVVSLGPTQLSAGKIYTVILTGTLTGTGTSGLTLTVIGNN